MKCEGTAIVVHRVGSGGSSDLRDVVGCEQCGGRAVNPDPGTLGIGIHKHIISADEALAVQEDPGIKRIIEGIGNSELDVVHLIGYNGGIQGDRHSETVAFDIEGSGFGIVAYVIGRVDGVIYVVDGDWDAGPRQVGDIHSIQEESEDIIKRCNKFRVFFRTHDKGKLDICGLGNKVKFQHRRSFVVPPIKAVRSGSPAVLLS